MIDKPRLGYADKAHGAHLHAPPRYLPIIVVPGIMGTRLTDPKTDALVWNPLGFPFGDCPKGFTVGYGRMTQTSAELVPDETHGADDPTPSADDKAKMAADALKAAEQKTADYKKLQQVRHLNNLVVDFYGDMIKKLVDLDVGDAVWPKASIKTRVYACGYDWRLDNARSALRLAAIVEEALSETRERKVIIIAHGSGGHVARYYSRALGGEAKILRMFLIGSPIMGFPEAYDYLKHGVPGLYIRDFIENTDPRDRVAEGIAEAGTLSALAGASLSTRFVGGFKATYGLFFALCLGAGRYLRRKETLYFVRQMPALYQLLPNALYCRDHHNWLIFDPFATGHLPTGYMLVFPTLFQDLMSIISGIANAASPAKHVGDKMQDAVNGFLAPEEATRTSPMATLMYETIGQRMGKIKTLLVDGQDPRGDRLGFSTDADLTNRLNGAKSLAEVFIRVTKFFLDCRSNRTLYTDIYTGLLDLPEQRALAGGNLALAFRLDEALTVDPCPIDPESPLDLLKFLFMKLLGVGSPGSQPDFIRKFLDNDAASEKKTLDKQAKAKAYLHPATVLLYGTGTPVEAGSLLMPTDIISNFDSNKVEWMLIPGSILSMFAALIGPGSGPLSAFGAQEFGDGTVPMASANPPAETLSTAVISSTPIPASLHNSLCGETITLTTLETQIRAVVADFLAS